MKLSQTSEVQASSIARGLLHGAWIVGIEYWRTAWSITLSVEEDHPAVHAGLLTHPFELALTACQIELANAETWAPCLACAPVDIVARPGHQDGPAALLLFNCVAYQLENARVESSGSLLLSFSGGRQLVFSGDDWSLAPKYIQDTSALIAVDMGAIYASSAAIDSILAASAT
ncbi:MAG: hypothetical protein KGN77_14310 [Xanthomonadaceae bacterium]|nr:hypothetical protein [Xanthomonadaceae bacterium]MDE1963190.1 hypothetical protein [Xanthomonadaceae bacterium]